MAPASLGATVLRLRQLASGPPAPELDDGQLLHAFIAGDQAAFAALVRRHGPLVFSVCHNVLRHEQDAEDAFQATFLTLARKAASVRKGDSLAAWLHGVAFRVSLRARRAAARRQAREAHARPAAQAESWDAAWHEVQAILDEEVSRLPERYRVVFVLCCLEGHDHADTARRLGLKKGTVSSRLAEARRRLRERLTHRGLALSSVVAACSLSRQASAAQAAALVPDTVRAAVSGAAVPGWHASRYKIVGGLLLTVGLLAAGAGALAPQTAPPRQPVPKKEESRPPAPPPVVVEEGERVTVRGRVLDPDGKPVPGAQITMHHKERGRAGPDGRFRFSFAKAEANEASGNWRADAWPASLVVAAAPGYGPEWTTLGTFARGDGTLRLVKDDVAITGRVKDLQGKPVVGASVWVAWLKTAEDRQLVQHAWAGLTPNVTTDKSGRFTLRGVGRNRTVILRVAGPGIEYKHEIPVVTRAPAEGKPAGSVSVEIIALPSKPIEGTVTAKDTGKPLAGVEVGARLTDNGLLVYHHVATTDARGRYRITGVPKGRGYEVRAKPAKGQPYLSFTRQFGDTESLKPIKSDFSLRRGVALRFRLIDKGSGKPVPGIVQYDLVRANPHWAEACSPFSRNLLSSMEWFHAHIPGKDLTIDMVVYPGPVVLIARAGFDGKPYLKATLDPADAARGFYPAAKGEPLNIFFQSANAYRRLDLKPTDRPVKFDLFLDPGRTIKGKLLDPDGRPVHGATAYGLSWQATREGGRYTRDDLLKTADFAATSLDPNASYTLSFIHQKRRLIGHALVRGDAKGPLTVRTQRWGAVAGRLVDATGEPLAGVKLTLRYPALADPGMRPPGRVWETNGEGRFLVEGLLPGLKHELAVEGGPRKRATLSAGEGLKSLSAAAGATRELGDVKVSMDPVKGK